MGEQRHGHIWHRASPEIQAAIDRTLTKVRPAEELDREHCRRLAALLGLRPRDDAAEVTPPGGDGDG